MNEMRANVKATIKWHGWKKNWNGKIHVKICKINYSCSIEG